MGPSHEPLNESMLLPIIENMKFVVSHLDQQMGPFDEQELKSKWSAGEILPIDYVFDEAKQDWILLAERFPWAAKPVVKTPAPGAGGPPPVRQENIMKRAMPPAPAAVAASLQAATPTKPQPPEGPAPTLSGTTVVSASKVLAGPSTSTIAEGITLSEPLRLEPLKAQLRELNLKTSFELDDGSQLTPSAPAPSPETVSASAPAPLPAVALKPTAAPEPAQITIVNGVGQVELAPMRPGEVRLVLQESPSSPRLHMTEPLKINIKASEPVRVEWTLPSQQTVGQDLELSVRALDDRGVVCAHYQEDYTLQIRGPSQQDLPVRMSDGQALIRLNHIKAETWTLSLHYSGQRRLQLPESRTLEWLPGAAARLVLDGTPEFLAGDPMKVQVRAVDAYGNTARTFQGTVVLEVKAS